MKKILFAGESVITQTIEFKGFDSFEVTYYNENGGHFIETLEESGFEVDYLPCHLVGEQFPYTAEEMKEYGAIIISDVGANTFLLSKANFQQSKLGPNRLDEIAKYVKAGGGLAMMGGYMSFSGINAKAMYAGTGVEEALPVGILGTDDRVEVPQGTGVHIEKADHPVLKGIGGDIPKLLGYNKLTQKEDSDTILTSDSGDILAAATQYGEGRSFAFASDIAPHWAPPAFVEWEHYATFFGNVTKWLCQDL